jgi:hypothetical protein
MKIEGIKKIKEILVMYEDCWGDNMTSPSTLLPEEVPQGPTAELLHNMIDDVFGRKSRSIKPAMSARG